MKISLLIPFLAFLFIIISGTEAQRVDFRALEKEVMEAKNNKEKAAAMVVLGSAFPPPQSDMTFSYADSVLSLTEDEDEEYYQNASDYLKALAYYRKGALDQAKGFFKKTSEYFPQNDPLSLKSLNFLGITYMRTSSLDSARMVFNKILQIAPQENIRARLSAFGNLGRVHRQLGNYAEAILNFEKCVSIDSSSHFSVLNSYLNIASIFASMDLPQRGIETLEKVSIVEIPPQPVKVAYFNNIGELFYKNNQPDSALKYLTKGYELAVKIRQYHQTLKNRILMINIHLENDRLDEAASVLVSIKPDLRHYPVPPVLVDFNLTSAQFFIQKKQYDSALYHCHEVLTITQPKNLSHQKKNAYELIALIYEEMGKAEESRDYYKLYSGFQDSVEQSESEKFMKNATARYMLTEKDALIASGEMESSRLKQWHKVLLFGIFGLILSTGLLSRHLKKSKSSHQEQIEENEELTREIERNKNEIIELKSRAVLQVDDIISIKADGHYLEFKLTSKEKPEIDRNRIKSILSNLPSKFIQIHRSYIVNVDFIKIKYSDKVVLNDGSELPVSRTFKEALNELIRNS